MNQCPEISVVDRATRERVREVVFGDRLLRLAYASPLAGLCRAVLFRNSLGSRCLGWYAGSRFSRRRIAATINQLSIDMTDFEVPEGGYSSFNDFFTRRLKPGRRPFVSTPDLVCSPADCRMLVLPEGSGQPCPLPVKGLLMTPTEVLGLGEAARRYTPRLAAGAAVVARL